MAEKRWTPQQLAAIESDGTLTVLSAAAGSGKTTVLVEKALRMLLDEENKTPADRLLIVTFSNASAKEFKNRIEKGINEAIKNNPDNAYIKSQKVALQKADISTIHSFCIKLTRENFEALDIAPDFTICDEAQSFAIHEKAVDLAMEYGYGKENFRRFASIFGKSSQDKQIREFLKDMFYYFSALPNPQKRALQLAQMDCDDFARSPVYRSLWSQLEQQIEYAEYLIQREVQLMEEGDVTGYRDGILANSRTVDMLCNACKNNDVFLIKSITAEKLASLGRVKKGEGSVYSEAIKTVNGILSKLLDEINEDVQYLDGDLFAAQNAQTKGYIQDITDVFVFYSQKLMELKKEQKAFEFSDFEHFAVQLLMDEEGNPTPLALSLRERYVKIMEDEFQDTSYVQDMIFNTIAQPKEKNLFVVGDVKQSIYGFRKASPEILLEKRSRGEKSADLGNTIVLPNNFRSEVNVIKAVNLLFENIMTKYLGGVDYCDGEQLQPAPGKTDSGSAGVSILVANDKENEANMVAQHIYTMVQNGYSIVENGVERSVKYGDFCILMRNKKHFDTFSEALSQYGIKAFVNDDKPLLETREVESVISLLRVINNPLQEVYLTAGMFGDIFDFTLDEILQFKLKNKKENLYNLLAQSENEKAQQFLSVLRDFAFVAKIYSPDKLVDYIISKTGYYRNLAFGENGSVKRENIRRFISFAKGYVTGYRNSLGDFIRYIDLVMQTGKSGSDKAVQPPDTVAIMTMHTSKGLEFPVVFVSGLGTAFNRMDRSKRLMIDPVLGMATYANE
ncbi:MAG: UvrD-helicase domain-containing protein, partial [Oscillospiraceae bacterium]|nr:UvrD-helicase domain-containing protein [Oscillospiraceae bacterium]